MATNQQGANKTPKIDKALLTPAYVKKMIKFYSEKAPSQVPIIKKLAREAGIQVEGE